MRSTNAPPPVHEELATLSFEPTRAAGLERLTRFLPHAGLDYARTRNIDRGPQDRSNVSGLSPYVRRRLVLEEEITAAVLATHGPKDGEKFIQEIFWRTYWKGWLEMRPSLLQRFDDERRALGRRWAGSPRLERASRGETGIACFDAWSQELTRTGWLHNHARMWFASIWIFTLELPWQLGADVFYKRLLDADPAANTLSWRWVAGLHTPGKHYLARAANIRANTLARFDPAGRLNETALPLSEASPPPSPTALPAVQRAASTRVGLLLSEEDLHAESWAIEADVIACAALESPGTAAAGSPAERFSAGALQDGLARAGAHFGVPTELISPHAAAQWAKSIGAREVVTAYAPAGLIAWRLREIEDRLQREGIRLVQLQRPWDARAWPHAGTGYFKFKAQIPTFLGLAA